MRRFILVLTGVLLTVLFTGCQSNPSGPDLPGTETIIPGDIILSEVMPDNEKLTLGHELEWIELYSRDEETVDLSHYALTDDLSQPNAYPLTGLQIRDGEYVIVVLPENAPFHLSAEGETVYLTCQGNPIYN